jgi:hypothetical protein
MEDSYGHGNDVSGSIKCSEVREWLQNWWLLKKVSAPLSKLVACLKKSYFHFLYSFPTALL